MSSLCRFYQDAMLLSRKTLVEVAGHAGVEIPVKASLGKLTLTQLHAFVESIKVGFFVIRAKGS